MTPEEIARKFAEYDIGIVWTGWDLSPRQQDLILESATRAYIAGYRAAVEEEREVCAKVAEEYNSNGEREGDLATCRIEERIRARGKSLGAELTEALQDVLEQEKGNNEKDSG